jgi:hypothetical protein
MHKIDYDNITTLIEDIAKAPAGDIAVVMSEHSQVFQASLIATHLYAKGIDGLSIMDDLLVVEGRNAFLVKKA